MVIALATGIFVGGSWSDHFVLAMIAGCASIIAVAFGWVHHKRQRLPPLLLMGSLGYILISPWFPAAFPSGHISHYTNSHKWHIEGCVTEILPAKNGRQRFVMQVNQLKRPEETIRANGLLRVTVAGNHPGIASGTRVAFYGRIRSFRNFKTPGSFNYERYMRLQRIYGSAFVLADRLDILLPGFDTQPSVLSRYRSMAETTINRFPDPDARAIMQALLIGDRQAVSPELRERFNRCGISHLLAISGLHIGIIGGLFFAVFHYAFNRVNYLADRGWGRATAIVVSIGPVVFYALLAGFSPATQRALIMVLAVMATYCLRKDGDAMNFLALAAFIMLVEDPPMLFSISFQLSFAAVFWILLGATGSNAAIETEKDLIAQWRFKTVSFLRVSLWATAGTMPLVMMYFQRISIIGILANCLFVPLIGFVVLPVGLCSLLLLPINTVIASWGLHSAGWVLSQTLSIMAYIDTFNGIALTTFIPSVAEILIYYGVLGLIILSRQKRLPLWALLIVLAVVLSDALYWSHERYWHRDLRVTVMDVGQGSSALVEFPGGRTMLIDGGGFSNNKFFDVGQRILAPFLRRRKILHVDTIVLSHPSSDHMNGLVYILAHFSTGELLWTGQQAATESFRQFVREVERSRIETPAFKCIAGTTSIGGVDVSILHPSPVHAAKGQSLAGGQYNNNSIVLKLTLGLASILFPGDIETRAEEALVMCCRSALSSRVLVAPHHGSRTSSSPNFIEAVRPEIVIISAGWRNRFGFPHEAVLNRYHRRTQHVYRTDEDGAVHLRTKGGRWHVCAP
jgi:competence protein ComEC